MIWLDVMALALIFAAALRCVLIVSPPSEARLPDPSQIEGMPMAGPASPRDADAVINRRKR
jgi:hypothetical protein